ncbi:MAG: hypothetical protein JRG83_03035 [Deltaproteobacteria bacterium]|nr:hypothetical protein [Deltaproteobacteria bacterium]
MPVGARVEAGALFGFEENNVRVRLSKRYAAGRLGCVLRAGRSPDA